MLRCVSITKGTGCYADRSKIVSHDINPDDAIAYFKEKGVNPRLLEKLQEKIRELDSLSVI